MGLSVKQVLKQDPGCNNHFILLKLCHVKKISAWFFVTNHIINGKWILSHIGHSQIHGNVPEGPVERTSQAFITKHAVRQLYIHDFS